MKKISFTSILGYAVATVTILCGVGIFAGILRFENLTPQLRYTFATVLMLWGIYRAITTYTQDKQRTRDEP